MSAPDTRVLAAQCHNASRMDDRKLLREFRMVATFSEQPPLRVAYLDVLRDEIAKRGLSEPTL